MSVVISIENVSKLYKLGTIGTGTLSRDLNSWWAKMRGRPDPQMVIGTEDRKDGDFIWALRDVSFKVEQGELLGIIGRNGAGKSTLLKIISRITSPTSGEVKLRGRVASLLEVGTGFHPELTGRENIFLNGAILGMRKSEIRRKLDEIVAFAEVEKFIDTPVKRYSSGMHVRLAFAVAAHLEPEILLIDEVLAVGDAAFQKKCLGKMDEVTSGGRTVLFVSHNMGAIKSLTHRTVWINHGNLQEVGPSSSVVDHYLSMASATKLTGTFDNEYLEANRVHIPKYIGRMRLKTVRMLGGSGQVTPVIREGEKLSIQIEFEVLEKVPFFQVFLRGYTADGDLLFTCFPGQLETVLEPGIYQATIGFNTFHFLPGSYSGCIELYSSVPQDYVKPAYEFEVVPDETRPEDARTTLFGLEAKVGYSALGLIRVRSFWEAPPEAK
jgi:lipopolysaccharide transport system ATP-binding protein